VREIPCGLDLGRSWIGCTAKDLSGGSAKRPWSLVSGVTDLAVLTRSACIRPFSFFYLKLLENLTN